MILEQKQSNRVRHIQSHLAKRILIGMITLEKPADLIDSI